jgi:hypothetical protein
MTVAALLAGLVALAAVAVVLMRERTVYFLVSDHDTLVTVGDLGRARLPPGGRLRARLRPGTHPISVTPSAGARSDVVVSPFSTSHVVVPLALDACIVVADPGGLYEGGDGKVLVHDVVRPGDVAIAPPWTDVVTTDICEIPFQKRLLSTLSVIQAAPCVDVPSSEAAAAWLRARAAACRLQ